MAFSAIATYEIWTGLLLLAGLILIVISDIRAFRVPDSVSFPLILTGLIVSVWSPIGWVASLVGALIGYAIFAGTSKAFERLRGYEGLGLGDAKLLAVGGAWCGAQALPVIVLIAALSGLLFAGWRRLVAGQTPRVLPFAPFLGTAIAAVYLNSVVLVSADPTRFP